MHQPGNYPPYHYPNASGDQNSQGLQGFGTGYAGAGPMFGNQAGASYNFDQSNPGFSQSSAVPVCQMGPGSQLSMQPGAGGFGFADFSGPFNQYTGMGQNVPQGLAAMQAGLGGDVQQFGSLMASAFGQPLSTNSAILEAIAHEQGLAGFNPMAFLQDPNGFASRGGGRGGQRGGLNKFGAGRVNSNLPSVTNPDGLREDTVFVSNLPQTIDHETMKTQFGQVGKIKINTKSNMPMVWIFKEKGIPKGEALVTFEDPQCVEAAIKWFAEHDFLGRTIEVRQATNSQRPVIIPPGGGAAAAAQNNSVMLGNNPANLLGPMAAQSNQTNTLAAVAAAAGGGGGMNTMANLANLAAFTGQQGGEAGGENDYSVRGFMPNYYRGAGRGAGAGMSAPNGGGRIGGSAQAGSREGDWTCATCDNVNFSWRDECNRCHAPRPAPSFEMPNNMGRGVMGGAGMMRGGGGGMHQAALMPMMNAPGGGMPGFGRGVGMPIRGGRGGGPMRGTSVGVGRARHAPY